MKKFIISPPFGSFIRHPKCTSVMGTYTLHRRGGWLKKLYRAALTVRPVRNGWINNIGLQNPGIISVRQYDPAKIYSIAAVETAAEWDKLIEYIPKEAMVELNLSCPNIGSHPEISDSQAASYIENFSVAIFKLSPSDQMDEQAERLVALGATYFHLSNTLAVAGGGESGERLKAFSLKAIKRIKSRHPGVKIIGGGGMYSLKDVELYKDAGADHFSLATIWFNPLKALHLLKHSGAYISKNPA